MINRVVKFKPEIEPCHVLNYCPYGALVEDFEYHPKEHKCDITGHLCPAFKVAEYVEGIRDHLAVVNKGITSDTVWLQTPGGRIILGEFPEENKERE